MNQKKTLLLLFIIGIAFSLFSAFLTSNTNHLEEKKIVADTLLNVKNQGLEIPNFVFGTAEGPSDLDPHLAWDSASIDVINQVCEGLFTYNLSDPELPIIPNLATDDPATITSTPAGAYDVYFDGGSGGIGGTDLEWHSIQVKYTFHLIQNATMHDGRKFNATIVKQSFDRLAFLLNVTGANPDTVGVTQVAELYEWPNTRLHDGIYADQCLVPIINRTEIVSEFVIDFILNKEYMPFIPLLTFSASSIFIPLDSNGQETLWDDYMDTSTDSFLGTGPFVYDSYEDGIQVNFHSYENYWQGQSDIQTLTFAIINDANARNQALIDEDVDLIDDPTLSRLDEFIANPEITLVDAGPGLITQYLGMNCHLINSTWRNAISYCVDYNYITEEWWGGHAVRSKSPIPEGITYSNSSLNVATLNITKARQIMQFMGYGYDSYGNPWGIDPDVNDDGVVDDPTDDTTNNYNWSRRAITAPFRILNFTYNIGNQFREDILTMLTNQLSLIGVQLTGAGMTWTQFIYRLYEVGNLNRDMLYLYWLGWGPDYNDPNNFINPLFTNRSIASNGAQYDGFQAAEQAAVAFNSGADYASTWEGWDGPYSPTGAARNPVQLWDNVQFLMEAALTESNQIVRKAMYDRIQQLLVEEDMPWAYGYLAINYDAYRSIYTGFPSNSMGRLSFYPIQYESLHYNVIHIDGNQEWVAFKNAGFCTGQGTLGDPYVIKDWIIDGFGFTSCISIENSDVYFTIENCTLIDSENGIYLSNVSNALIQDNFIQNNSFGINCININESIFMNNDVFVVDAGIYLYLCYQNSISANELYYNPSVTGYPYSGITLDESYLATLTGNLLYGCGVYIGGTFESCESHTIDTSNLVNLKPVYYYAEQNNLEPDDFSNAGQVILISCNNSHIENLLLFNTTIGVYLLNCENNTISNITTYDISLASIVGFYCFDIICTSSIMSSPTYGMGGYGIVFQECNNTIINENLIRDQMIALAAWGDNNVILGNIILNSSYGLYIFQNYNNITNNLLINNSAAIFLHGENNHISSNNIVQNEVGINFDTGIGPSYIYQNNFINNTISMYALDPYSYIHNIWNSAIPVDYVYHGSSYNNYLGNYWDDYSGLDLNGDGIGDDPYLIDLTIGEYDLKPLIEPFEHYVTDFSRISILFDGMYLNYTFKFPTFGTGYNNISFSQISSSMIFHAVSETFIETYEWDENNCSRVMANSVGGLFNDGMHSALWIFTDISIGDLILIAVDGEGDHIFRVVEEIIYNLPGYGLLEAWKLEDLTSLGGVAIYEKTTGILLNGTFYYQDGVYNYSLGLLNTNVLGENPPGDFILSSTAGDPDPDGNFDLTWTISSGAANYSVYQYSSYITEINGSLTLLADQINDLSMDISGYLDDTYYFIVLAHNDLGDTLSNCIGVTVEIPILPGNFILSSTAEDPDPDGNFDLTWTVSSDATNYSVYRYSSLITEINGSLTLLADETIVLSMGLSGYSDGTYYFIVVAHNDVGDTLSNCIEIIVEIPKPIPGDFTLSSSAEDPDPDGNFDLTWTVSSGATNYSIYRYSSFITEINGSLTLLADETIVFSMGLSGYSDGTYYFIVVAHNDVGDTLSNCIEITVLQGRISPRIPGFNLMAIFCTLCLTVALLINKNHKKKLILK